MRTLYTRRRRQAAARLRSLAACALASIAAALTACASDPPRRAAHVDGGASTGGVRVLLLGEVHDNPDGHRQRHELLAAEIDAGWRPAIAMEQFDRERQADLDGALAACADADCVIRAAAPADAGWDWPLYRPVIDLALRHRLPIVAANVSRVDAARVVRGGFGAALDTGTIVAYGLDRPLPPDLLEVQRREIVDGHCGMLPASVVDGMVRAQIARDIWMAKVVSAHATRGVALLAGNGHIAKDHGVARWLTGPAAVSARSIGFVETRADSGYDSIRPIRPHLRPDPCAAFGRPSSKTGS